MSFEEKIGLFAAAAPQSHVQKTKQELKQIRPSVSAVASQAGAVRAMAAMFNTDLADVAGQATAGSLTIHPHDTSRKSIHNLKAVSLNNNAGRAEPVLRSSGSRTAGVAATGASIGRRAVEGSPKQHTLARAQPSKDNLEIPQPWGSGGAAEGNAGSERMVEEAGRHPWALGTIVPHQEQPPVAQHLNLARPPSVLPATPTLDLSQMLSENPVLTPRPSSTTLLHAQIRKLQLQLDSKTEETAQLRRQLEAQEGIDIGTLSEQLREAKREASMWKERAEAAERRVQVFEKFTAKLRGIRQAAAVADQQDRDEGALSDVASPDSSTDENVSPAQHIRFAQGKKVVGRGMENCGSGESARTEDAGMVTARIRKCLHGDGADDTPDASHHDLRKSWSTDTGRRHISGASLRNISDNAVEIWMAAQELLSLDDEDVQDVASVGGSDDELRAKRQ